MALDYPIRKTSINLYEEDCKTMEKTYGRGWTETVRDLVNKHVRDLRRNTFPEPGED